MCVVRCYITYYNSSKKRSVICYFKLEYKISSSSTDSSVVIAYQIDDAVVAY